MPLLYLLVPVVGVEPTRYRYHWILSPARLPIPSHRLEYDFIIISHRKQKINSDMKKIKSFFEVVRRLYFSCPDTYIL